MFLKAFSLTLAAILRLRLVLSSCCLSTAVLSARWYKQRKETEPTKWNEKIKNFNTHSQSTAQTKNDELAERKSVLSNMFLLLWARNIFLSTPSGSIQFAYSTFGFPSKLQKFICNCFRQKYLLRSHERSSKIIVRICSATFRCLHTSKRARTATCIVLSASLAWSMILHVWLLFIMFFWAEITAKSGRRMFKRSKLRSYFKYLPNVPRCHPQNRDWKLWNHHQNGLIVHLHSICIRSTAIVKYKVTYCKNTSLAHSQFQYVISGEGKGKRTSISERGIGASRIN